MDLLLFIEGWDYHPYTVPYHVITKTSPQLKLHLEKPGWILSFGIATTDAFGTAIGKVKGPGGTEHVLMIQPENALVTGFIMPDPTGYLNMYNRPFPASTAGFYIVSAYPGFSGSPLPIIGDATVETYLDPGSTQNAAWLTAYILLLEIKDKRLFLEGLAKFGSPAAILGMASMTSTEQKAPSVPAQTTPGQLTGDLGSQILEELKKIRENLGKGR